ncbi:hypothetical protein [Streptomyces sp. NP-1717]|uniref:hypothetical protein n=1 Tax=unclassified Streptomyces TaxID=2593676 RepID=UPI001F5D279C|nr:hypothetical protein [Streptomyces sp. NP-1717]MCI3222353.1 hypothetical protein [Streptomyces sp. NP-1717]WTA73265.1 hypothetical protein OG705_10385 [Streptomyces sp. NBC_00838]
MTRSHIARRSTKITTRAAAAVLAVAVLAGCGEGGSATGKTGTDGKRSASTDAEGSAKGGSDPGASGGPGPSPSADPDKGGDAYDFTPSPEEVPKNVAQARELTRNASLEPADWTPGMVKHEPYETAGTWPVLADSCVWSRGRLPGHVLDSYGRRIDVPAKDGKGRVQGSVTVTVHRTVKDADREMKDTVQESFRCPGQELGGGQRLDGLMSMHLDQKEVKNADATLFEAGKFTGPGSGGKQEYVWTKSRIGTVTTAVAVKGAEGYGTSDLIRLAAEAGAKVLYRVEKELT